MNIIAANVQGFCCADIPWFINLNRSWVKLIQLKIYSIVWLYSSSPDYRW